MATEGTAMNREATIAELRRRLGIDLAWDEASDEDLATMLADAEGGDDRFAVWAPSVERRAEAR